MIFDVGLFITSDAGWFIICDVRLFVCKCDAKTFSCIIIDFVSDIQIFHRWCISSLWMMKYVKMNTFNCDNLKLKLENWANIFIKIHHIKRTAYSIKQPAIECKAWSCDCILIESEIQLCSLCSCNSIINVLREKFSFCNQQPIQCWNEYLYEISISINVEKH